MNDLAGTSWSKSNGTTSLAPWAHIFFAYLQTKEFNPGTFGRWMRKASNALDSQSNFLAPEANKRDVVQPHVRRENNSLVYLEPFIPQPSVDIPIPDPPSAPAFFHKPATPLHPSQLPAPQPLPPPRPPARPQPRIPPQLPPQLPPQPRNDFPSASQYPVPPQPPPLSLNYPPPPPFPPPPTSLVPRRPTSTSALHHPTPPSPNPTYPTASIEHQLYRCLNSPFPPSYNNNPFSPPTWDRTLFHLFPPTPPKPKRQPEAPSSQMPEPPLKRNKPTLPLRSPPVTMTPRKLGTTNYSTPHLLSPSNQLSHSPPPPPPHSTQNHHAAGRARHHALGRARGRPTGSLSRKTLQSLAQQNPSPRQPTILPPKPPPAPKRPPLDPMHHSGPGPFNPRLTADLRQKQFNEQAFSRFNAPA